MRDEDGDLTPKFSLGELLEYCVTPTLSDSTRHLYNLLIWSLIFTLTTKIGKFYFPYCVYYVYILIKQGLVKITS